MNTLAISPTALTLTPLPARPAPITQRAASSPHGNNSGTHAGSGPTVVKMRQREAKKLPGLQQENNSPGVQVAIDPLSTDKTLVTEMTRMIALASLEVLSGVRSVQQLSRWLDSKCLGALTTRARLHASACQNESRHPSHSEESTNVRTLRRQPVVHSIHISAVAPGIYETSVVIADKTRFRAIAMRFEESAGVWKVTALQIG